MMDICSSCSWVHEDDGVCFSRHAFPSPRPRTPAIGIDPLHSGTRHYRRANWSMDWFAETLPTQGCCGDFDGDGVSNYGELINETAVASPDTDGDGLIDGESMTMSIHSPLFTAWIGKGIPYQDKDNFSCQTSQTRNLPLEK